MRLQDRTTNLSGAFSRQKDASGFVERFLVFHFWVGIRHNAGPHMEVDDIVLNDRSADGDIELRFAIGPKVTD